ncbi:low affinity vacuolar monovalent cation/H(+) antiporter-like [Athene cunicularia]|uniref:low affinity vacuolar monovalent cation/H(+) antiporter-like n=1 Tax=Athene cunicularia TaxID=194338 RepID=UPI000EF6AC83|nr:low affinity vacuolar monovalent cation/H(+) antiporter-like [Athene cunicularia]
MASEGESGPQRRRCCTQEAPDVPKATEPQGDSDSRGSLCDRHCAAINNVQGDLGDLGCHLHRPRVPPAVSPLSCCQQHSEEVCESCVVKTTLTAENAVEANKLSNNYKFGFKKWKSHVTARPWEDRSEIVKELYSDLNVIRGSGGSTVTCGNILYLLLFGWWLSLLYVLVAAVMFVTVVGAPYGWLCWDLAGYFLWPFGKVIQKVEVSKSSRVLGACEAGAGESSALLGGPVPRRWRPWCWVDTGHWQRAGAVAWLCLGYPVLVLAHGLVCVAAWLLIFLIPVAKLSARAAARVLLLPPEQVLVRRLRMTEVPLEGEVILCCYRAVNPYYYKYAVDGINVFAMDNNGTLYYSHVQPLVYTVSLLLPAAYLIGLFFTLKTHSHIYDIHISDCHMPGHHHSAVVHWSRWRALVILLLSTLCMSACADLATEHISPILTNSTISQYFIGVTVLAMVPELPEIVNGIQFALQNNLSLSIEIGNCIAVQVCMLQIPILVLFTIFYPTNFTLVFSDLHVYASMFSVVLMNYIFMDGKCDYFQGTVLVMVYFILLAVYFFAPSPSGC